MRIIKVWLMVVTLTLIASASAYGWSDWLTLKTEHFTVFYKLGFEDQAKEVLQTMEFYRPRVESLCGNREAHLAIVIDNTGTLVNGFTDPLHYRIHLFQAQPVGWAATENWWALVGVHEYTHELSINQTSGVADYFTDVFGKSILWTPNFLAPGWILEGITVYNESQITDYQGRLNDGLYDAYIGARVKDGRFPSILEATNMPQEYQQDYMYTFGGEFVNYLAKTYGEAKLTQFFEVNGGQIGNILFTPAIGIDRSARKVFGKSFPELWRDWSQAEAERFRNFDYEGQRLTRRGWHANNLQAYRGKLFYQRFYPVKTGTFAGYNLGELVEYDPGTGREKVLVTIGNEFSSDLRVKDGRIYYATPESKAGYANASELSYGYYNVLHQYDLATRKDRVILQDEFRGFEVLDNGLVLYSKQLKQEFGSELYRLDPANGNRQLLFKTEYLIDELVSVAGRLVVNARRDWASNDLYLLNLTGPVFTPLVATPYEEKGISVAGNRLFFTANYEKNSSVYCYDFTGNKISRLTANGWVSYPVYDEATRQLYFMQLSSFGTDLFQKNAEFREYQLPVAPLTVKPVFDLKESEITRGAYRDNLKTLAPRLWFPMIDTDADEYGVRISGGDAVMDFPEYYATLLYNTKEQKVLGDLAVELNYFAPFQSTLTLSRTVDEDEMEWMFRYPLLNRLSPGFSQLAVGAGLIKDEDYKGVGVTPFVQLGWQYPRSKLDLQVSGPQSRLKNDENRSGFYATANWNYYLGENQIHLMAKYLDDPKNPDAVFDEIRGYDDELDAKKGKLFTLEYSRPLFRIHNGLWNPSLYFENVYGTLFMDRALPDHGERQSSWGVELHLETKLLYGFFPLDWGGRYTHNREGDNRYEVFVRTQL
jgi:hypothetical protein